MLENLTERLEKIFKRIRGYGKLSEENIAEALREVRVALLEADVNLNVVKNFIGNIQERAVGAEVMKSLTPGQQVVKIVKDELINLLGSGEPKLARSDKPPTVYMMVGLQGSGKTTTCGKIGRRLKKEGHKPLFVAADIYRPAATEQLKILGKDLGIPVVEGNGSQSPEEICKKAMIYASEQGIKTVIVDTAGRLHIDEELMAELANLKSILNPHEILLVADAMTGQDAVNVATAFKSRVEPTGIILTKMDGDARGGAVLSLRNITNIPVKFIGTGEKLDQLELFYPDRMASRILGMGDVLSLIEKAEDAFTKESAEKLEKQLRTNRFSLDDFRDQMRQIRKMGSIEQIMGMLPGMGGANLKASKIDDRELNRVEAIINSMTQKERLNHTIINGSRKKRIAEGSGTDVKDVNRLIKQFVKSQKMLKQFSKPGFARKMGINRHSMPF
jgi:signal recognition particle subunit SRP54